MARPWWKTHPQKYWTAADWAAARKAGVVPPTARPTLDPAERLLIEQAQAGPKMTWGTPPSPADSRRREANRVLEEAGLRPRRW